MNNLLIIGKVNELQGVCTTELGMYNLLNLYVDGVIVAFIRAEEDHIQVFVHFPYSISLGAHYSVDFESLEYMIERYRITKYFDLKRSS